MNLFKYFKFYYKLTEKKIMAVILLSMIASVFETLALAAIATVIQHGTPEAKGNAVANFIYPLIHQLGVEDSKTIFALLLIIAALSFTATKLFLILTDVYIINLQTSIFIKIQKKIMNLLIKAKYEYFALIIIPMLTGIKTITNNCFIIVIASIETDWS